MDVVRRTQLANIINKAKSGKVLSRAELELLERGSAEKQEPKKAAASAEEKVWLSPSEFIRWANEQGVSLSRKSFYKTYFGRGARHPVERSKDGKRVHRDKALELIRMVQADDYGDSSRIICERQAADARVKSAKARMAEIELETLSGQRPSIEVVKRVWGRAVENLRGELRTLAKNMPDELFGKAREEMTNLMERRFEDAFRHVSRDMNYA